MRMAMTTAKRARSSASWRTTDYDVHYDDFPTPPWAVRAFFHHVAPGLIGKPLTFLEPACGRGHMVSTLKEYKFKVRASDMFDYDRDYKIEDYLTSKPQPYDVMMTNPPYRHTQVFVQKALSEARVGVAVLARTMWLEGAGRYTNLFLPYPPARVVVFSRRMQATHGKIIRQGSAIMNHSWFWWDKRTNNKTTQLDWLPPDAQRKLEKDGDYD